MKNIKMNYKDTISKLKDKFWPFSKFKQLQEIITDCKMELDQQTYERDQAIRDLGYLSYTFGNSAEFKFYNKFKDDPSVIVHAGFDIEPPTLYGADQHRQLELKTYILNNKIVFNRFNLPHAVNFLSAEGQLLVKRQMENGIRDAMYKELTAEINKVFENDRD